MQHLKPLKHQNKKIKKKTTHTKITVFMTINTKILIKTQEVNTWTDTMSTVGLIFLQFKCLFSSLEKS